MLEANMKKQLLQPDLGESKSSHGKRSNSKFQSGDQASVFGGPLSMKGGLLSENPKAAQPKSSDVKLAPLNLNTEVAQKKLKKRIQLKNLIITKFRNKYCVSIDYSNTLNDFIQKEIDDLFCQDTFDERDLVAVDRKVRNHVLDLKKAIAVRAIKKDPQTNALDTKQATLATARQLDDEKRLNDEPTLGSGLQKSHILLSNTHNSHTIADTFTKNAQTTKSNRRSINNYVDDRRSSAGPDDIFSVTSKQRGMSQKVIENNRLASQFVSKRLIGGNQKQNSQSPPHRDAKTAFSGQGSQFGSITGGATMYIKARQDDYWNKIANYNRKIYELEQEEAAQKKLKDQSDLRNLLASQINAQKASNDNQNEKDRKFMNWQLKKAEDEMAAERQRMQDKKKLMQHINQERTQHQKKIIEEWNKERQSLTDYQLETIKLNHQKQEQENKMKMEAFQARRTNAETNIERYRKLKVDSQQEREAEKRKFSPVNSNKIKESIEARKMALEMEKDFVPENQTPTKIGPGSNAGDDVASKKSYQNSIMYATLKSPLPVYNDVFADIFQQKQHPAYIRQERASKRAEIIGKKFSNVWAVGDAEMDKKIAEEFERRTLENAKFLDMKRKKQVELARTTLQHQKKQIDEKRNILDSDKKKERDEYIKDKKQLEQIDKQFSEQDKKRAETLKKNREDLMNQIEEQQIKNLNSELMNPMDYKLNRKMIGNLTNLVVLPRDKRKPF